MKFSKKNKRVNFLKKIEIKIWNTRAPWLEV